MHRPIGGVPLLTALGDALGWRAALGVAGMAGAAAAWFVAIALPADHRAAATPLRVRALLAAYAPLLGHPASLRLFAVSGLRALSWLGLLTCRGAYLGQAVGLDSREIGIVYMLAGGGYVLGSVAAGGRLGALAPRVLVAAASLATGLLLGPLLIVDTLWVVVPLLVVASFASAAVSVGVTSLLAVESPAGAGTTMVLNGSILNLGAAGGAALGGVLTAAGGYPALGIGLPVFAFLAAILAAWPAAKPRHD